jgi:uncharacterized membrane protein
VKAQPLKKHFALISMIVIYIALFGVIASLRHYNFQTQTWDMAVFVQVMWNSLHGHMMQNSLEEIPNTLGVHMSPILFFLLPGYAIFQTPYFLLIVQTIALGVGAIPLYFLAFAILKKRKYALAIAGMYLLYPSLHWINIFDFHPTSFFIPLLLGGFYYAEKQQWIPASVFFFFASITREDSILVVLFSGLYFAFLHTQNKNQKQRRIGILLAASMLVYFIVSIKFIMPALGGGLLRLDRYQQLGSSFTEIFATILTRPSILVGTVFTIEKMRYLVWLFLPVTLLPLFSGRTLLLLVPGLLENLLTTFSLQFSGLYQYDAVLIPALFVCTIYGFQNISQRFPKWEKYLLYILLLVSCIGFTLRSPVNPFAFPIELFSTNTRGQSYSELVRLIPADVSVSAYTNLVPHLAHREHIYMLGHEPSLVDILVVDGRDPFGFKDFDAFERYVKSYTDSGAYNIKVINDYYAIISRKGITLALPQTQ